MWSLVVLESFEVFKVDPEVCKQIFSTRPNDKLYQTSSTRPDYHSYIISVSIHQFYQTIVKNEMIYFIIKVISRFDRGMVMCFTFLKTTNLKISKKDKSTSHLISFIDTEMG